MAVKKNKNFLKNIKTGGLTTKAKKAGALTPQGTIKKEWINKQTKSTNPETKAQAVLAKNMASWSKGKKKSK